MCVIDKYFFKIIRLCDITFIMSLKLFFKKKKKTRKIASVMLIVFNALYAYMYLC